MKVPHRSTKDMSSRFLLLLLCNVFGVLSDSYAAAHQPLENITTGNELWSGLVKDCEKPTAACIKNSIYDYLKDTLDYPSDVQFTSFLRFSRNFENYTKADSAASEPSGADRSFTEETPLEEISRSLKETSRKFLMTHDLELQLPETFFSGTTLKISPRSVDDSSDGVGTLVKLELFNKEAEGRSSNSIGEGRIFIKKIQEYIGERLLLAFLAILVVIKLLAVKILFVLPAIIGVAAAKKLILKIVLFLFPALHHLFKLCAYTPYGAKHHIHKHQISHIHQVAHGHKNHPYKHHYEDGPPGHHYGDGPPGHHYGDGSQGYGYEEGPPGYHHEHGGYDEPELNPSGPYFGNEIISHRRDPQEENEVDSWGQGQETRRPKPDTRKPLTSTEIENIVLKAEKEALIKSRLQKEKQRIHEENLRLQHQLNNALKLQEKLKQQTSFYSAKVPSSTKTRYPATPLVPPPRPPPNKFLQGPFAEPPYSPNSFGNSLQAPIRVGNAVRNGNSIGPQNAAASTPIGQHNAAAVYSIGQQTAGGGQSIGQHNAVVSNLVGFKNAVGLSSTAGHSDPMGISDFVKHKTSQSQQQVYPVYSQNAPEQTFIQDYLPKQTERVPSVEVIKSVEVPDLPEKPQGSRLDRPFDSFPEFEKSKPQGPSRSQYEDSFPEFGGNQPQNEPQQPSRNQYEDEIYKAASVTYDAFYSPILEKIDKVLNDLDFIEEPCRERLICSMYKNPTKFSPHSNLLSTELSRDSSELKKPTSTNSAVVRFYKYVQAARDGQDKRDCIRLYPACAVNTEAE
ncbi:unnamed protein product [Phaedon cochleariae]|uniref:Uncharacterized protein n=1 Tax=Phaedon cochleariae TaxID=80249 RepID=A0A9P0DPJ5_PHACE|nr:unnamed protein product [Phaedon cochleariae]